MKSRDVSRRRKRTTDREREEGKEYRCLREARGSMFANTYMCIHIYTLSVWFSGKSKNTLVTSYFQLTVVKIPGSLIRLPTITSKRRRSVKLFHFITSSFFFHVVRPPTPSLLLFHSLSLLLSHPPTGPPFLHFFVATINFITLSSFDGVAIARSLSYQSVSEGVLLNFGVKSFP